MSVAKFQTVAKYDRAGGPVRGVVSVDRSAGLISARSLRSRRTYELPLSAVADFICRTVILSELRQRRVEESRGR
jgi:hypothetical protein